MMDKDFLLDYTRFVDEVTSDASSDAQSFSDALDVIDGFGVSPERILTAAIGISAEGGEFAEIVKKSIFQGKPMDDDAQYHMKRELGDIMWYITQACIALGISLEDVLSTNIQKLEARYPDGFEAFRSENRKEGDI
jgi:NTP pyrophosphatase (non-canonical NTP hydrolase)|tara:strand:- start:255 stop:662 length:408 start_codon:yes stop_codon:yes gene_type:complete